MKNFNDYLEQHAYGGQLDSEGHFTLGKDKALEKMAEMALVEPAQWVLKMVQAAVVQECQALVFKMGRRIVQVDFYGPAPDLSELRDGLLEPSRAVSGFWEEAFVGLRTLLFRGQFRARSQDGSWVAWDGHNLHHDESESSEDSSGESTEPRPTLSILVSLLKEKSRAIQSRDMHKFLADRAIYAPLQLIADGREIRPEHKFAVREPDFTLGYPIWTTPLLYAHFHRGELDEKFNQLRKARSLPFSDALRNRKFFLSLGVGDRFTKKSCHLNLQFRFQDEAVNQQLTRRKIVSSNFAYELTRFGVICRTKTFLSRIGGCLHLPYDEGRSDLSGLNLDAPSRSQFFLEESFRLTGALTELIGQHRSISHFYPPDSKRLATIFAYAGAAGAFVTGLVTAAPLVLAKGGAIGGALGSAGLLSFQKDTEDDRIDIIRAIRALERNLTRGR